MPVIAPPLTQGKRAHLRLRAIFIIEALNDARIAKDRILASTEGNDPFSSVEKSKSCARGDVCFSVTPWYLLHADACLFDCEHGYVGHSPHILHAAHSPQQEILRPTQPRHRKRRQMARWMRDQACVTIVPRQSMTAARRYATRMQQVPPA